MKIRYTVCLAGSDEVIYPGETREVSAEVGKAQIEAGNAEPVDKIETASAEPAGETAVSRKKGK